MLDVARARAPHSRADWQAASGPDATGRAFITRTTDGRKLVRVIDRHPADEWLDVRTATLATQLARAYIPPVGWVERHGGTGTSRRPGAVWQP